MEVEDIVSNVLSRLPVKSLMRCKSVCKYWRGLISTPGFIRLHLNKSKENPSYIAYPCVEDEDVSISTAHIMKFDGDIFEKIPFPDREICFSRNIVCSFDGLICWTDCSKGHLEICISNPVTREVTTLPKAPHDIIQIGVALGPQVNEFKVFGFFKKEHCRCDVYSSVTKSWRGLGHDYVAEFPMRRSEDKHISVNGVVYWFMSSRIKGAFTRSILAIDREENFIEISLPGEVISTEKEAIYPYADMLSAFLAIQYLFVDFVDLLFFEFEGCLSLVSSRHSHKEFDIWILKDGNESIWVKKCTITIPEINELECIFSVAARKNEILFILWEKKCLVYGVDNKTWRELKFLDVPWSSFPTAFAFTESLLPCKTQY